MLAADRYQETIVEKRRLGKSQLTIAPLMLGGNVFGWTADEKASFAVLDAFVDAGLNAIDTADVYSAFVPGNKGGESETVLGNWFAARKNRGKVVLATKVGMLAIDGKSGLSRAHIARAVEDSLKRLKTDYIDLYFAHRDDESTPLEETLEAFAALVKAGKVRTIGASNYSPARLKEALAVSEKKSLPRYEVLQPHYNLADRKVYEAELQAVCRDNDLGVVPYFALALGFLTGKYRSEADASKSPRGDRVVKGYLNDRGKKILAALDSVSARLKATPAQVSLAWLMARPTITAPIASATSVAQMHDLVAAVKLKLDRDAMAELDAASEEK
ncbi:MAG TPA: aldo/keto reductase [Rhizomicrobium sp.]|jgi:aryl-alcohol dehydrogenase-like predicted oxidoreductase